MNSTDEPTSCNTVYKNKPAFSLSKVQVVMLLGQCLSGLENAGFSING